MRVTSQQPLYPDNNYFGNGLYPDAHNLMPNNYPREIYREEYPEALHFFNAANNGVNRVVYGMEGLNLAANRIQALPVGRFRQPIREGRLHYQAAENHPRRGYRRYRH